MRSLLERILYHQKIEGIKLSLIRKDALLIYSGGQTRLKSNSSLSESTSYSNVANSLNLYQVIYDQLLEERQLDRHQRFRIHEFLTDRVTTEEFALDSWTNLVFSVARFKEFTGHYPHHITVIGHSFKSKRFQEIHREALRWPSEKFEYVSIQDDSNQLESRYLGEKEVFQSFGFDRYGCLGKLMSKRISRNPFRRFHSYLISNYELTGLLEWCPANGIDWYPGPLPWSNLT
ncbi:uncharacterized protein MELLADRAFT_90735 [Melampsora larici-populina 98AG31]|uniref:Uncharacterized protein n=1 Tax=Melampsora larici-populina (strain 98AG31 / pathotype 3-4-7) TaxID=747676 RepID=F4R7A6_MELLP|nr:uncharacterized protein MELLADRAFT_90735 [Melampsora larici-populina 98AG31]EGG11816.1 hypothetical protein MELLADRAFT_90735 [Melampsora larici-populina 98AG31]